MENLEQLVRQLQDQFSIFGFEKLEKQKIENYVNQAIMQFCSHFYLLENDQDLDKFKIQFQQNLHQIKFIINHQKVIKLTPKPFTPVLKPNFSLENKKADKINLKDIIDRDIKMIKNKYGLCREFNKSKQSIRLQEQFFEKYEPP